MVLIAHIGDPTYSYSFTILFLLVAGNADGIGNLRQSNCLFVQVESIQGNTTQVDFASEQGNPVPPPAISINLLNPPE